MEPLFENISKQLDNSYRIREYHVQSLEDTWYVHPEYELTLMLEGEGRRIIGNHNGKFGRGDLVLIGKYLPHCWLSNVKGNQAGEDFHYINIQIKDSFFGDLFFHKPEMVPIYQLLGSSNAGIMFEGKTNDLVSKLTKEMVKQDEFDRIINLLKIFRLLVENSEKKILSSPVSIIGNPNSRNNRISIVYEFIKNNFNRKISLREIADHVNMSPSAFCRFFKNKTHKTFFNFLLELKINHACRLLRESDISIAQVAFESGYENIALFNMQFKSQAGMTPHRYRNSFRIITW